MIDFDDKDPHSPTVNNINKNKSFDEDLDRDESAIFDRLLGFDVCGSFTDVTSVCGIFSSPAPVLFKARPCYECGRNCNKIGGYTTEIVEKKMKPTSGGQKQSPAVEIVETKVYYHKWCLQIKEWRTEHAKTYHTVMVDLRKHVRNKNVYVALVRRARVRRREKDLKTRQNVALVDKENKRKVRVVKHASIFSGFSVKKKSSGNSKRQNTEGPDKRDLTDEKKKKGSLIRRGKYLSLFPVKKKATRNSDTQNTEASDKDDHTNTNKKKKKGNLMKRGKNLTLFSLMKETVKNSSTQNTEGPDKDDHTDKKKKNGNSMKRGKDLSLFSVKKKTGTNPDNQNTQGPANSSDLKNEKKKNGSLTKRAKYLSLFSVKKSSARNSNTQNREGSVKIDRTIEKKRNTTKSANKKVKVVSSGKSKKNDKQHIKPETSKKKEQSSFFSRATKKNKLNVSSKNKTTNSKVNRKVEKPAVKKKKFNLFRSKDRNEC